jgi:hypothetical protein
VVHVPAPEACRHLQGTHPQTGQVGVGRGSAMWARGQSSAVRTPDGRGGAVLPWGERAGRWRW